MPVDDTFMEGMETRMTGEGEDTTGTETTKITPPSQEVEGMLSSEEENPEVSSSSKDEEERTDQTTGQRRRSSTGDQNTPRISHF
jgi:hypothetical protein